MRKLSAFCSFLCFIILAQSQVSTFPHFEDFESEIQCSVNPTVACPLLGTWWNDTIDEIEWTADTNGTQTTSTGPEEDHTLDNSSGRYLYTESSLNGSGYPSKEAFLLSAWYDFSAVKVPMFQFWYHMFGDEMGSLHVDVYDSTGWNLDVVSSWTDSIELWQMAEINLIQFGNQDSVRIRLRGITGSGNESDMAIDDLLVFAAPPKDVGLAGIVSPITQCALTANESVEISVKNLGANTLIPGDTIHVNYQLNNNPPVQEAWILSTSMLNCDTLNYTFSQTVDVSMNVIYTFRSWTSQTGDGRSENDTLEIIVQNIPSVTEFPFCEDFEDGRSGWFEGGERSSWGMGSPDKVTIVGAASGAQAWVTGGTGLKYYNNHEHSYVTGPCFDFTNLCNPWIDLSVWWNSEFGWDGANLQYSTDAGINWVTIGLDGDTLNWYTDSTISGMPGGSTHGWTGRTQTATGSNGWRNARHELGMLAGNPDVWLRVAFGSDGSQRDDGFGFDKIRVYDGVYLGPDQLLCTSGSVDLRGRGMPGDTYLWSTGATTENISVSNSGSYWCRLTHSSCVSFDTVEVISFDSTAFSTVPFLGADTADCGPKIKICAQNIPGSIYYWANDTTYTNVCENNLEPCAWATATGPFRVRMTNVCGTFRDTINVTILPFPIIGFPEDTANCETVTLDAGPGHTAYNWSTGTSGQTDTITSSGTYWVHVTGATGCDNDDTLNVVIHPKPIADLGVDTVICPNIPLCLSPTTDPLSICIWSTGHNTLSICTDTAGAYSVTCTDQYGCISEPDTINVSVTNPPPSAAFSIDTSDCPKIQFTNLSGGTISSYAWDFGDGGNSSSQSPNYRYNLQGNYTIQLIVSNSCGSDTSTQNLGVFCYIAIDDPILGQLSVYPNPAEDLIVLSWKSFKGGEISSQLIDISGRALKEDEWNQSVGDFEKEINLTGLSKGIYFLNIQFKGRDYPIKIYVK